MSYAVKCSLKINIYNSVKIFLFHSHDKTIFCYTSIIYENIYSLIFIHYICDHLFSFFIRINLTLVFLCLSVGSQNVFNCSICCFIITTVINNNYSPLFGKTGSYRSSYSSASASYKHYLVFISFYTIIHTHNTLPFIDTILLKPYQYHVCIYCLLFYNYFLFHALSYLFNKAR